MDPLAAALVAAAVAEVRPASPLRVASLVERSMPALLDPYLRAGALARRVELSSEGATRLRRTPARPYHDVCRLVLGASLESAGVIEESLELVLVGSPGIPWLGEVVAALAPGGVAIVGDEPAARSVLEELGVEASSVEVDGTSLIVVRRGRVELGEGGSTLAPPWSTLDRCACVDRRRVAAAIAQEPRMPSQKSSALSFALAGALSEPREPRIAAREHPGLSPQPPRAGRVGEVRSWAVIERRLAQSVAERRGDPELGVALLEDVATLAATLERAGPDAVSRVLSRGASDPAEVDLLLLVPHPDDETVYFGGLVAAASRAGLRLHVATLTGGEGGLDLRAGPGPADGRVDGPVSAGVGPGVARRGSADSARPIGLAEVRASEQSAALEALGAGSCGRSGLGFADTGKYVDGRRSRPMSASEALARWDLGVIVDRLEKLLRDVRPRAIVTMDSIRDPNYSLHAHHLACGAAALVAAGLAASGDGAGWPLAGLWTVQPSHVGADMRAASDGVPLGLAQIPVDIDRKLAALAAYPSQGYSTQRLIADLEASQAAEGETFEVLLRRARFSSAVDPIQLHLGLDGRCA